MRAGVTSVPNQTLLTWAAAAAAAPRPRSAAEFWLQNMHRFVSPQEAQLVLPKLWSSVCGPPGGRNAGEERTRIDAIGDSLTAGDNMQSYNESTTKRCKMSDTNMCRGNFPFDLRELLGQDGHDVRNFGIVGISACGHLPNECLEARPTDGEERVARLPLLLNASRSQLDACSAALNGRPSMPAGRLLGPALAFDPHVVLLMIGTNDAASAHWDRCGIEGYRRALLLLLREIWRGERFGGTRGGRRSPPFVALLPPPPVLGEYRPGACVSMHAMRGKAIAECTSCGKSDLQLGADKDKTCVSVPELALVRHVAMGVGRELHSAALAATDIERRASPSPEPGPLKMTGGGREGACSRSPLLLMHQSVPPLSTLFTGPLHLNAKGSALIACAVHERLHYACGSNQCDKSASPSNRVSDSRGGVQKAPPSHDMLASYNASRALEKHLAYCEPLRRGVAGPLPQQSGHPHGHTSHAVDAGHEAQGPQGAAFWDALQGVLHRPVG